MSAHADCVKYFYQTWDLFEIQLLTWYLIFIMDYFGAYIYIYVWPCRKIHVQLGIYWCLLLFDMCLPASTHFINLNFFILLGFFFLNIDVK